MHTFGEKFKSVDFEPKIDPLFLFPIKNGLNGSFHVNSTRGPQVTLSDLAETLYISPINEIRKS